MDFFFWPKKQANYVDDTDYPVDMRFVSQVKSQLISIQQYGK